MKIGVHALAAFKTPRTGVEEYTWQLLKHLGRLPESEAHEWVAYRPASYAGHPAPHSRFLIRDLPDSAFWTQTQLSRALAEDRPDVLFIPAHVLPRVRPQKTIVTVHGLEWEKHPKAYSLRRREYLRHFTKEAASHAHRIIVPSRVVQNDLQELYRVSEEKVSVIPHGAPIPPPYLDEIVSTQISQANLFVHPFFLFLGRIEQKKNIDGIVNALEILREESARAEIRVRVASEGGLSETSSRVPAKIFETLLILAGPPGHGHEHIRARIEGSPSRSHIRMLGYVPEQLKWQLVRNATALLLPSWSEGFGIPILEAQAVGTPVITSMTSSMPEVGGRGALYVNPANPGAIAEAMFQMLTNMPLRRELIRLGHENVKRFSWEDAARKTLRVLTE